MSDFTIRRGDTLPVLTATLSATGGSALDLTGATVEMHLSRAGVTHDRACAIASNPATGVVTYSFAAADWTGASALVAGTYRIEFEITFTGGAVLTVPTTGHYELVVEEDLA